MIKFIHKLGSIRTRTSEFCDMYQQVNKNRTFKAFSML